MRMRRRRRWLAAATPTTRETRQVLRTVRRVRATQPNTGRPVPMGLLNTSAFHDHLEPGRNPDSLFVESGGFGVSLRRAGSSLGPGGLAINDSTADDTARVCCQAEVAYRTGARNQGRGWASARGEQGTPAETSKGSSLGLYTGKQGGGRQQ
jgi:hypothetical protein